MKSVDEFIEQCQEVIAKYETGKLSLYKAAAQISANPLNNVPFDYPFDGPAHLMIYKVADLAFDIVENYRTEEDDKADWALLKKTLENYVEGKWESTCWILRVVYGKYVNGKLIHSYNLEVRRQNGKAVVNTALKKLRGLVNKLAEQINSAQTDERYLQNLAKLAPKTVDKYKLTGVEVGEYLTGPYYPMAAG